MPEQDAPWKIGDVVTRFREDSRLSQRQLSEITREIERESNSDANGIPTAQLSRIERGAAVPDLREIILLGRALRHSPEDFLPGGRTPWYAIRFEKAIEWLGEVKALKRHVRRHSDSHKKMMGGDGDEPVYLYVPLVNQDGLVKPDERSGELPQLMQKYLFEVTGCDLEVVKGGLDHHEGEEIVWVIEGELEFWTQENNEPPRFITLTKNDSLHYSSRLRHGYRAGGKDKRALALFVYTNIQSPPLEITIPHKDENEGGEPHETSD